MMTETTADRLALPLSNVPPHTLIDSENEATTGHQLAGRVGAFDAGSNFKP